MSSKGNKASIIDSISNWIKLLALIVLVAEGLIMFAMSQTPIESPIYPWYPFIMIFFLFLIIIAVFIDRVLDRKSKVLSIAVNNKELSVDPIKNRTKKIEKQTRKYTNGLLGYSFDKLEGKEWQDPKEISFTEFIKDLHLIDDVNEEYLKSLVAVNNPFGSLLFHANILEVKFGSSTIINIDELTTTESVEHTIHKIIELKSLEGVLLSEEEVITLRKELNQTKETKSLGFGVKLNVMTFNKKDLDNNSLPLGLPNFFMSLSLSSREPIDSITSNSDMILWTCSNKLKNCVINEKRQHSFDIYRLYQLVENKDNIYLCQAQWSPHIESSVFAWDELKKAFESFNIQE